MVTLFLWIGSQLCTSLVSWRTDAECFPKSKPFECIMQIAIHTTQTLTVMRWTFTCLKAIKQSVKLMDWWLHINNIASQQAVNQFEASSKTQLCLVFSWQAKIHSYQKSNIISLFTLALENWLKKIKLERLRHFSLQFWNLNLYGQVNKWYQLCWKI